MTAIVPDSVWLTVLLMLAACCLEVRAEEAAPAPAKVAATGLSPDGEARRHHLTPGDSLGDLLNHPAFAGYVERVLPWDDRAYDGAMALREIGSLLPYHSNVDPGTVVAALNRMIDDVAAERPVFHDIYSAAERRVQPDKAHAGLFFFRGRPDAPFAVIAPGGGFAYVGSVHEGFPYALDISRQGLNAFVLKYRAGHGGRVATEDLAAALSYIFRNAETLGVSTGGYSLWGSSAGARMAAAIGTHGVAAFGGDPLPKPAAVVMAYTAHSDYGTDEPPTFVIVGGHDDISPPSTMRRRVAALRSAGTEVAYHEYDDLGHGFGPGTGTSADGWITDAVRFWERFIQTAN